MPTDFGLFQVGDGSNDTLIQENDDVKITFYSGCVTIDLDLKSVQHVKRATKTSTFKCFKFSFSKVIPHFLIL